MPLFIGQLLNNNRYRIEQQIGKGGFGAVYRALDTVLKQPCAVKENIDTSLEAQRQFEREALLLARLRHSNLPRVIDHFFIPNQGQYLVMDFVEGQNLAQILAQRGGPLTEQEALAWIGQIGQALNYLHQQQPPIIHRDIKPQNIIVTPNGQAILVDFGISKVYDVKLATALSVRALTPGFAPPEQYGLGRTDARSDVYALGATLYTLLTNQYPPDGLERLVHNVPLAPPSQFNHQVSSQVEQAILKALEPTTTHRLQSINEFQKAIVGKPASSFEKQTEQAVVTFGKSKSFRSSQTVASKPQTVPVRLWWQQWPVLASGAVLLIVITVVITLTMARNDGTGTFETSVIDFESIPDVGTPTEGMAINTQFLSTHGIRFSLENGTSPVIAKVGSPGTAFMGPPDHTKDDTPAKNQNVGSFFLTDNRTIFELATSPLVITYDTPTAAASGVILDIDFDESWTIEARDAANNVLSTVRLDDTRHGNTGDGIATSWSIDLGVNEIYSLRFEGTRTTAGGFGLAFDNFNPRR